VTHLHACYLVLQNELSQPADIQFTSWVFFHGLSINAVSSASLTLLCGDCLRADVCATAYLTSTSGENLLDNVAASVSGISGTILQG